MRYYANYSKSVAKFTTWKVSKYAVFLVLFSCIRTEYGGWPRKSPYFVRMQKNTDQKKLRIWTLFMLWLCWESKNLSSIFPLLTDFFEDFILSYFSQFLRTVVDLYPSSLVAKVFKFSFLNLVTTDLAEY